VVHVNEAVEGVNVPRAQSEHAADATPVSALAKYFPSVQAVQDDDEGPEKYPASHEIQIDSLVAADVEPCFPARHEVQEDSFVIPLEELNLPAGHARQAELEAPPDGL
jgi:hypothetical protein